MRPPDLSKPIERVTFYVDKEFAGTRLDRYLQEKLPWRSRTGIQKLVLNGKILRRAPKQTAENPASRPAARLLAGETLIFLLPERPQASVPPPAPPELKIVFEDEYLIAVDKPPFLPVHPSQRHREGTLINLLHKRYRHPDPHRDIVPKLCHRIDRETSGVILVAKDDQARSRMGKMIEGRKVGKEYLALVEGRMPQDRGQIDLPLSLARDSEVRIKMEVRHDGKGLSALSEYEVVERRDHCTLVGVKIHTGRQHQIRVHLAGIGHPIIGDKIYGPDEGHFLKSLETRLDREDLRELKMPRHALHAHRLRFTHPMTKREMVVEAELPADMRSYLEGESLTES